MLLTVRAKYSRSSCLQTDRSFVLQHSILRAVLQLQITSNFCTFSLICCCRTRDAIFYLPHTFFFFVNHNAAPLPTVQSEMNLQILIRHYTAPSGATQGFMQLLFTFTIYTDVSFLASSTCSMAFCSSEIGVCYINVR